MSPRAEPDRANESTRVNQATRVNEATRVVVQRLRLGGSGTPASAAVILGSGLGPWASKLETPVSIPYPEIPGFATTTAAGHRGELIAGRIDDATVVAMAGRFHRYEGHGTDDVMFPVRLLANLGIPRLIVTNAAGGLNPNYAVGDLVVVSDHIDRLASRRRLDDPIRRPVTGLPTRRGPVYDPKLSRAAVAAGLAGRFVVHRGTYFATTGPTYETRAEYRMMRRFGADVVGMSTVPEAIAGADAGMRVLAVSIVSNVANPDRPSTTDHQEVLMAGRSAMVKMETLLREVIRA